MDVILSYLLSVQTLLLVFVIVLLKSSIKFVPQNRAYVIERFGKYQSTKEAGLNFIVPFIDRISADRSLKEKAVDVPEQSAITKDNISLSVDGVLYFRVLDPYKATYGIDDYVFAVTQLAQTTMRSELGKMELDKTFEERDVLNTNIVAAINEAAGPWGIQVLRYEIKDIVPPSSVMEAMEAQMKAEAVLRAEGEAKAIVAVATAQAEALRQVGEAAATEEGQKAIQLDLATKAIEAKLAIAKESSVVLLPDSGTDIAGVVAQATTIINSLNRAKHDVVKR